MELVQNACAAALKRFGKQSRSRTSGSHESCLNRVYSVCLWGFEISDHTQVDMKQVELVLYARAAALRRFCKQSGSKSAGSRESCLVMVHSVCLLEYGISNHTQVELVLYARAAALKRFCKQNRSRSSGSREGCLVIVHSVCLWGY